LDIYDVFVTIDEVIEESKRMFSKIESFHHAIELDPKSSVFVHVMLIWVIVGMQLSQHMTNKKLWFKTMNLIRHGAWGCVL
jgi:hypothetical protein